MTITELAEVSGASVVEIRALEHRGLLLKPYNKKDGYREAHVVRLDLIQRAEELGFTRTELLSKIACFVSRLRCS